MTLICSPRRPSVSAVPVDLTEIPPLSAVITTLSPRGISSGGTSCDEISGLPCHDRAFHTHCPPLRRGCSGTDRLAAAVISVSTSCTSSSLMVLPGAQWLDGNHDRPVNRQIDRYIDRPAAGASYIKLTCTLMREVNMCLLASLGAQCERRGAIGDRLRVEPRDRCISHAGLRRRSCSSQLGCCSRRIKRSTAVRTAEIFGARCQAPGCAQRQRERKNA